MGAGPRGTGQPRRGPDRQGGPDAGAGGPSGKEGTSCGSTRAAGSGPGWHQGRTAQLQPSCCLLFLCPLPQDGRLQQVVTRQGQQRKTLPAGVSLKTFHSCGNPTGEFSPTESTRPPRHRLQSQEAECFHEPVSVVNDSGLETGLVPQVYFFFNF